MKRLRFKKPFEGLTQTLQLIPESYRVNGKTFEMTDGKDSYRIKWANNRPTIIETEEKNTIDRLTSLMEFDSKKTLGNVIGEGRINENDVFKKSLKEADYSNMDGQGLRMEEFEEEPMGMGPGNGMQDGSGPGNGQGMGMEPQGLGGVEHGMDPMPMEMDTTQIKNAAFEILKGVLDPEMDQELLTAINVSQGSENMDGVSTDPDFMGPESIDGVPVGGGDEYSDEMLDIDDYGQSEFDINDEMEITELDDLNSMDEGVFTDLFKKKNSVAIEDQSKEELSVGILKNNPSVGQYPIQKACKQVGIECPPIDAMDTGFFTKLYKLLDNSNLRGVDSGQLMSALTTLDENKQQ